LYGCFTPPKAAAYNKENAVKIEFFCFVAAALAALTGMGLGMYMGLSHNFALAPAHAHINLLGWVTMCLYGLYHRGRNKAASALSWIQVGARTAGFFGMGGGIAGVLTIGGPMMLAVALGGASLAILSMLMFLVIVIRDGCPRRNPEKHEFLDRNATVFAGEANFINR
jgi:hypothetical protein